MKILFPRKSLHLAIAEIAYIAADVASEDGADHRLHQTFDICEGENIHRVNNLIDLAFSEVAGSLAAVAQPIAAIDPTLHITDKRLHSAAILRIQETAREYIICRVLHGWLSVTLPAAAPTWRQRADLLLSDLNSSPPLSVGIRRISPF